MKLNSMTWRGVIPAMTTAFKNDLSVDHRFMAKHARWMVGHGCTGIVALGSLGESATLRFDEKVDILKTLVAAVSSPKALGRRRNAPLSKAEILSAVPGPTALSRRAPVVAGIASLSTAEAVELAR